MPVPDVGGPIRQPGQLTQEAGNLPPVPVPGAESQESTTNDSPTPETADNTPPQDALANQPNFAQPEINNALASVGDTGSRGSRAPNMIGDFIGLANASPLAASSIAPLPTTFSGAPFSGLAFTSTGPGTMDLFLPSGSSVGGASLPSSITLQLGDSNLDGVFDEITSPISAADLESLNAWLGEGGSGLTGVSGTFNVEDADFEAEQFGGTAELIIDGDLLRGGIRGDNIIELPRTGTHVSRYKTAESNSPLPRDRVFFNTSWFSGVPGIGGQQDVARYVPGFEQTFNDGNSSVEIRLPFASTFDQVQVADPSGVFLGASNTEFGNISGVLKHLIHKSDNLAVSAGLAVELATANDLEVQTSITNITRESESVHLLPFVGGLYTPSDRFFLQSFLQISYDTNGEQVHIEDFRQGDRGYGRLQEPTLLFADFSAGWWFYRNDCVERSSQVSGIAGILELHMTQTLQDTDSLQQTVGGVNYSFGDPNGSLGVANLTAGATFELGNQSTVTVAYVAPLTDEDRQFDGELQFLLNYYFDGLGSAFRNR